MTPVPPGRWRPMTAADLDSVAAISDAVHGAYTEGRAIFAERLALYPRGCHIFEVAGSAAGYRIAHPGRRDAPPRLDAPLGGLPADADVYYFHDLALLPAARGSGAGAAALCGVCDEARAAGFGEIALVAVNGADRYWSRHGFDRIAPYPAYGPEAVLMRRLL